MHLSNFIKIAVLSTALVLQAHGGPSLPKVRTDDFEVIQTTTVVSSHGLLANADIPTVPPFVPSAADLIVNTTVPQGESALLGWMFPLVGSNTAVFDSGTSINVTIFYTPPGGVEQWIFSILYGPDIGSGTGFCGFNPGFNIAALVNSSDLGTYTGRWTVDLGQSTQPDAPVDPTSGCGPEPFNSTTVEFVRMWEVVPAV